MMMRGATFPIPFPSLLSLYPFLPLMMLSSPDGRGPSLDLSSLSTYALPLFPYARPLSTFPIPLPSPLAG